MKASIYKRYGPPEKVLSIENVDMPILKDNEVMVKVMASSINRTDCAMLLAKPFIMRFMTGLAKPRNPILGTEFAGEVVEVGSAVGKYKKGDKVFGFNDAGVSSHAEYLTISEKNFFDLMPENYSFTQAAASIEGAHYAYNFINKVKLQPGDRVLVYGASGSIGSAMIQLLKQYRADITAIGNDKIQSQLEQWGVEKRYDYRKVDYKKLDKKFTYIFDAVGKINFFACKHLLEPKGIYISSELGPWIQNTYLPLLTKIVGRKRVKFPLPLHIPRSIKFVKKLIDEGKFEAVIDQTYALEDISEAFSYVASGQKTGTVVIDMNKK